MPKKPTIAIVLEGGVVQCVISDQPHLLDLHDIIVIDYDTEGADEDDITMVIQGDGDLASALVNHWNLDKAAIDLSDLETPPPQPTSFKVGDWVQTNGTHRVGQIDSLHHAWAIVQFGSGGPFQREFFDDVTLATPEQIAIMEGTA